MVHKGIFSLLCCILFFYACKENIYPKPKGMLRLEYLKPKFKTFQTNSFSFKYNEISKIKVKNNLALTIEYPDMKGAIFINYRKINNNLNKLIADTQKLSLEHAIKADNIKRKVYKNQERKVFGVFYEIIGNAASQAQFFVTDRENHFVTGSLYFDTKPNYDSIYPASVYLKNDMNKIIETVQWFSK